MYNSHTILLLKHLFLEFVIKSLSKHKYLTEYGKEQLQQALIIKLNRENC